MQESNEHYSVLLAESIDGLNIKPNGIYIDATFGRGGHSRAILQALSSQGRLIAIDQDPQAVAYAREQLTDARFEIVHASFADLYQIAQDRKSVV